MPWNVVEKDGKFCVVKKMDGSIVHCHDTKEKAMAQMRALYANDAKGFTYIDIESEGRPPMNEPDALVFYGGAVKAMGNGKLGGYLVEFSDPVTLKGAPDLDREFFAADTDYDMHEGKTATVYYDHGRDPVLKRRKLARGPMSVDDIGVWIETQLEMRDNYEKAIYKLAELGKLGWSSGSAPHLVERKAVAGFTKIVAWPLGDDASLTVQPSNWRSQAVTLKSVSPITIDQLITEVETKEVEAATPEPFTLPSLDAITAPAAKSGDINTYSSEVATALEIFAQHAGQMVNSLDPFCATVKSKQEFRFVKDGRTISKVSMGYLDDCWKHLTDAETAIVQGKAKIEDLRKTAIMTKSQRDAAQEAAKLQFEIFQRLTTAKETADVN